MPIHDRSVAELPGAQIGFLNRIGESDILENGPDAIKRMLAAAREHMGMEIAYISEFVTKSACETWCFGVSMRRVFEEHLLAVGYCKAREDTYCHHVLNGSLPGLMTDTALYPRTQSLYVTHSMSIRAHIGAPIYLPDGRVYGMLCCISPHADPTLTDRDMQVMKFSRRWHHTRSIAICLSRRTSPSKRTY